MRQWHHSRPGWKGNQSGRSHSSGGVGFTHYMVRRHVSKATADAVNKTLGGQATFYGQNY